MSTSKKCRPTANRRINRLFQGDCLKVLPALRKREGCFDCLFADPPDNIDLGYGEYKDKKSYQEYIGWFKLCLEEFVMAANTVWVSFNSRHLDSFGGVFWQTKHKFGLEFKPCVQIFTFGQHRHTDLGNNHRPLWRLQWPGAPLFPDRIRVPSWRQLHGDKRADERGRVPGDVFETEIDPEVYDFPRVVGNSKQRRDWHPTQLNEGLVERCLKLTVPDGGSICDPFGGTGTTLRVAKELGMPCTLIELDSGYCREIGKEHRLKIRNKI